MYSASLSTPWDLLLVEQSHFGAEMGKKKKQQQWDNERLIAKETEMLEARIGVYKYCAQHLQYCIQFSNE